MNLTRLAPQPRILDCGGKRSATPLLDATGRTESGVAATLCHRSPNLCRPCAKLQDCITDGFGVPRLRGFPERGCPNPQSRLDFSTQRTRRIAETRRGIFLCVPLRPLRAL